MAPSHGTDGESLTQALLDDSDFSRRIVERTLHSRVGTLTPLVPQDREGTFSTQLFARYQRSEKALVAALADRWRPTHPKVAQLIEEHIEECFAVYAFPPAHRQRLRSTNGWERLMQEIKRRTRVVRIFPNREACLRLVTALCVEQSDEWISGMRYLDISELRRSRQEQAGKEVTLMAV